MLIKIVREFSEDVIDEYYADIIPRKGEAILHREKVYVVDYVIHVTKKSFNGGQYVADKLDYIKVEVVEREAF